MTIVRYEYTPNQVHHRIKSWVFGAERCSLVVSRILPVLALGFHVIQTREIQFDTYVVANNTYTARIFFDVQEMFPVSMPKSTSDFPLWTPVWFLKCLSIRWDLLSCRCHYKHPQNSCGNDGESSYHNSATLTMRSSNSLQHLQMFNYFLKVLMHGVVHLSL